MGQKGFKKNISIAIFLLPSLLGMVIFVVIPILSSFVLSFSKWDLISKQKWVGVKNYTNIFTDEEFYEVLIHTITFVAGYIPIVVIMALIVAILLNQNIRGRVFFRAIYFIPVVSSWVAIAMIWKWLLNPQYGIVNYLLSLININGPAWLHDKYWAMPSIILTSVWKDTGFIMVIFLAGLQGIPNYYYEASKIDGANIFNQFFYITIPLLAPTFFFVLVISFINSFQVFDQVWIMTEGGPAGATSVLVEQIYKNAFRYYKMGYASALSWVLFAIIFILTTVQNKLQKRWIDYEI